MNGEQEELKIVQLFLTKITIGSFSLNDMSAVLEIEFNDGSAKEIYRNTKFSDDPLKTAQDILSDIVTLEENINLEFDGEQLTGCVNVVFHHYEGVQDMLAKFIEGVQVKLGRVRDAKSADGYLNLVRSLQNASLDFYG